MYLNNLAYNGHTEDLVLQMASHQKTVDKIISM